MKIGILTLPFNNNYGGYLQTYALMTVVKSLGHDSILLFRLHNRRPFKWRYRHFLKNLLKLILFKQHDKLILSQNYELQQKGKLMMPFINKYIPRTKAVYSTKGLKSLIKNHFDVIIIGSDQVWRPDYVPQITDYYLSFLNNDKIKRISYAASFGTEAPIYSNDEQTICGQGLKKFHAVSLRETSGINIIKRFGWTCTQPSIVLDPTMLLTKEYYNKLLLKHPGASRNKIFCYILDQSEVVQSIISTICEETKLTTYHIIDEKHWKEKDYLMPSIEDWLTGIRDSEYVVTDSFHGTVFSIIFNKKFVVYANKERGIDRFLSLLNLFNLTNRIAYNEEEVKQVLSTPIEWDTINILLKKEREKSMQYLINALKQ